MKFFILLFLLGFFISCGNKSTSEDENPDPAQVRGTDVAPTTGDTSAQEKNPAEELYTITVRGDFFPSTNDGIVRDLYFTDGNKSKSFDRGTLSEFNWCVAVRKSDFPHLTIRLQIQDKMIECYNSYASTLKCNTSPANLFLDLPTKNAIDIDQVSGLFPLKPVGKRNPEMDKCYKLY